MPHTPKITKRNLSNSSPSQIEEKKGIITLDRYSILNTDEDNVLTTPSTSTTEDPDRPPHKVHNAKPVAPPIHIKIISNFSAFNTVLKNITEPNGFNCKSTSSYLIVQPTDRRIYNAIIDHLDETNASFHSFTPQVIAHTESSLKIYKIPPYTPILLLLLLNRDIQSRVFKIPKTGTTAHFQYSSWISVSKIITMISMKLYLFSTQ
jgi:hypothetical protein